MPNPLRMIVLCADDFGLAPGVSGAIASLIARARLSATSCITITSDWVSSATLLRPLQDTCDVGLHLTLTGLTPLGRMPALAPADRLPSLGTLMRASVCGRLDEDEIGVELRRQLDAFIGVFGRPPDFIDGHQHIHVLPSICDQVLGLYRDGLLSTATTYLRIPWDRPDRILRRQTSAFRALVIAGLSHRLRREAMAAAIPINESFAGVRDFRPNEDYRRGVQRALQTLGARPIMMCHPGRVDALLRQRDSVTSMREQEYAYFASEAFASDLAAAGYRLGRFREFFSAEQPHMPTAIADERRSRAR